MSSSRPNSRTDATKRGPCPTCGSRRVIAVEEDVELCVGRRRHRFELVPHERCLACGERVFGIEASQRFDAVALRRRKAVRAGDASGPGTAGDLRAATARARVSKRALDATDA